MSAWMNDAAPNHNGHGFPHMNDPNAAAMDPSAFMANSAQFNPAQFANQQQQHQQQQLQQGHQQQPSQQQMAAMQQNGPMRHASPSAFQQNPAYQTNSVIPSKRPRPREDSVTGSPGQLQGMLPPSRSETPQQQSFAGMQQGGAMPQQTPGQFPHLQANGSANATPSPIMGNQMRPGSVPQRVATASPHPFSPGPQQQQQFASQTSPAPSEHGTPQPNQFMQSAPQGYNPGFAPSPSNARPSPNPNAMGANQMMQQHMVQIPQGMNQMQANMYAQMQQQGQGQGQGQGQQGQQRQGSQGMQGMTEPQKMAAYQMRLQQQLQGNMQMQAQLQAQGMGRGMMQKPQMGGMPNGQMPQGGMRPQQRSMGGMNPEHFMKNLTHFMTAKGLPFDTSPTVAERPVNLMMLFQAVSSKGGSKTVNAANGWAHIAQALGLPVHIPIVASTLRQVYERNLQKFEEAWIVQQKTRMMGQNPNMPSQGTPQKQMQPGQQTLQGQMPQGQMPQGQMPQGQMTPGQMTSAQSQGQQQMPQPHPQQQQQQQHLQQQHQHHLQQQQQQQMQQHMQQQQTPAKPGQAPVNGFATPQPPQPSMMGHQRNSLSKSVDANTPGEPSLQSPAHHRQGSMQIGHHEGRSAVPTTEVRAPPMMQKSDDYSPCARELATFGGVDLHAADILGKELEHWMPIAPSCNELGNIDIAALTRGLQCGMHSEVRVALDTLATLSNSPHQPHFLQLRYCDDLVDALIDCAEEQLDMLVENTVEVADEVSLTSYEDVVRACRMERLAVRNCPTYGTIEYDLDRAVDKIICVTTILRNVSFPGEQNENHIVLADEMVIKFLCSIIRYLGTRTMLLRSHANTLDFMKDIVILLSNIAGSIELPSREQALCLLNFLLAFAPSPAPTVVGGSLFFASYEPGVQPYLPHAVDSLAKLLARDEPNRGFYKAIFGLDSGNNASHETLTRTFALAIAPLPDKTTESARMPNYPSLIEVRKPFLMQGLLAAEILASMAPGFESGVAKAWLSSGEGLAQNLTKLVRELSHVYERQPPRGPRSRDPELVYIVVLGVTLLRRLAEKARDPNHPSTSLPKSVLPSAQVLMEALSYTSAEWTKEGMLQQLSSVINMAR
ncbi:hypothetical protein LLEC1_02015 [Akanthomyces lecanii]|uniref:ARID domain-containing protein n=1 Tax=Cordyceps confragosa TaxID=2714763 RepID=A0A179I6C6_CORDF|nr:hypothetical protein LLEC1_02015 [Akanthomyces lecanii]